MSLPMPNKVIICLMGPTGSGKTTLAVELAQHFPFEIISVDSALVYCGMDIGTAKPGPDVLQKAPHHLIDILSPKESYSAGQFCNDASHTIEMVFKKRKVPLLVGGTMLYFKALREGLARLPPADPVLRKKIQARAMESGQASLYEELVRIDPGAAKRIHQHDHQRTQRALEVYYLTGKPLSHSQAQNTKAFSGTYFHQLALIPSNRQCLHERIAIRFQDMLDRGFLEEARGLYGLYGLSPHLPAMRTVGYRQAWEHFAKKISYAEMQMKAVAATRQLAKRQLTWLRSWPGLVVFDSEMPGLFSQVALHLHHVVYGHIR